MVDLTKAPLAPAWLAARHKPFCLLCNGPTTFTNIYVPGKASPMAPPPGKGRIIIYSLCRRCAERLDVLTGTIERKIENELRALGVIPGCRRDGRSTSRHADAAKGGNPRRRRRTGRQRSKGAAPLGRAVSR